MPGRLSIPGRLFSPDPTLPGRVSGFNGRPMPRKSPRSPGVGRAEIFGGTLRLGRLFTLPGKVVPGNAAPGRPASGRFGSLLFGRFSATPPRFGILGRVVGRPTWPGRVVAAPALPLPGTEGRVLGRSGVAGRVVGREAAPGPSGVAGRVDGLSPPLGRSNEGIAGLAAGRFIFGEPGLGLAGADGRLLPIFGTLGRGAGRDIPPPPPPARPPPPPPPIERPPPPPPPPRRP